MNKTHLFKFIIIQSIEPKVKQYCRKNNVLVKMLTGISIIIVCSAEDDTMCSVHVNFWQFSHEILKFEILIRLHPHVECGTSSLLRCVWCDKYISRNPSSLCVSETRARMIRARVARSEPQFRVCSILQYCKFVCFCIASFFHPSAI